MSEESTKQPGTEETNTENQSFEEAGADQPEATAQTAETNADAGGEAESGDSGAAADQDAESRLAETEAVLAEKQNEILRLHAEIQNTRRRSEQDVEKAHKYGQEKLISELLPVIDNLERALQAATGDDEQVVALREGVELTLKSFIDCLKKSNVEALDPTGEPFDPQYHQAMSMVESDTAEPNSVVAVMQKGYALNGRVLRPAMVMVSKGPADGSAQGNNVNTSA